MANAIDRKILETQYSIENALNHQEMREKLATVTYNHKKLTEGRLFNESAKQFQIRKNENYALQVESTDFLQKHEKETQKIYKKHVSLARMAYENNRGMQARLDIAGERKRPREAWLSQAITFYDRIDLIAEDMGKYGVGVDELSQTKAMTDAIIHARQQQMQRKGEAQDATEKRDKAIQVIDEWMRDFKAAARVALKDHPQWLEMLGIQVKRKGK